MNREALLEKIAALGLSEYGVYAGPLAERLREKGIAASLIAALNNSDTEGVLLQVLEADPRRVFDGMKLAAEAAGTENMILQLPDYASELAEKLRPEAEKNGITVNVGLVNRRAAEKSVLCHIVTMAELADAFADRTEPGVYVSVDGAPVKKLPADTAIGSLLPEGVKAVQTGYRLRGPEALALTVGEAGIESGVLRGITDAQCVVAETEKQLLASRQQSCGKCVFCREGLLQLHELHQELTQKRGKSEYIDLMKEIGEAMVPSTLCSMGQKAAELPLTAMAACPEEYESHARRKTCPAGECGAFVNIYIDPQRCTGCGKCMEVCPADCIDGMPGYIHMVGEFQCVKCGKCLEACEEQAVIRTMRKPPVLPGRFVRVGKFKKR